MTLRALRNLLAMHQAGLPFTSYAKELRVAPGTLRSFLEDDIDTLKSKGSIRDEKGKERPKAVGGRAESVGRIYNFLKAREMRPLPFSDLEAAVAFGLDPENRHVLQGLRRAKEPTDTFVTQNDDTLKRIESGEGPGRTPNTTVAGILYWPPYSSDRRKPEDSFAGDMMRRLLGSLNPLEWGPPECISLEFHEILTPDLLKSGRVDAIFSAYDTSARRLSGFEFIHVPGLSAPLGAVCFHTGELPDEMLKWAHLLDPARSPHFDVHAVEGDAGQLLLLGACGYEVVNAIAPEAERNDLLTDRVVETLVENAKEYVRLKRLHAAGERDSPPAPFAFVADAGMVQEVRDQYQRVAAKHVELERLQTRVLPKDHDRPEYPIGIAVSATSIRWQEILRDAMVRELFINSGPVTARSYAKLLAEPSKISIGDLGPEIPEHVRRTFARAVITALEDASARAGPGSKGDDIRKRIREVIVDICERWTPGVETDQFRQRVDYLLTAIAKSLGVEELPPVEKPSGCEGEEK